MYSSPAKALVGAALLMTFSATLRAEVHVIPVNVINGAQETPPVVSAGSGSAVVTVDDVANTVSVTGTYSGLSGSVIDSHIHGPGAFGVPAGVLMFLTNSGGTSGTITLSTTTSPGNIATILGGLSYINIHTTAHGGGEIRGQIFRQPERYCFGDGGVSPGCTDCPCMNNAAGSNGGCLNPSGTSASLDASGTPSVSRNDLRMEVQAASPSSFGILTSGQIALPNNPANPCFGLDSGVTSTVLDGLRCVGQNVIRHGSRASDANGDIGITNNGWGPPNGPAGGLAAPFAAGSTRYFQVFYRVLASAGCGTAQNTTNGVKVILIP